MRFCDELNQIGFPSTYNRLGVKISHEEVVAWNFIKSKFKEIVFPRTKIAVVKFLVSCNNKVYLVKPDSIEYIENITAEGLNKVLKEAKYEGLNVEVRPSSLNGISGKLYTFKFTRSNA